MIRSGFYPITRVLADIWQRVAAQDCGRARTLALVWKDSPFLLAQRLYLHAVSSSEIFTPAEASSALIALSDDVFWLSGAQVEIMRLLADRWRQFSQEDRNALEARLAEGIPRDLFPPDAFEDPDRWESIWDSAVFKRMKRISAAGAQLSAASLQLLEEVSGRHPKWRPSPGDRDDFMTWMGEVRWGYDGHPELLTDIADDALVKEAMRLQRERPFEEGDVWRLFCSSDPDRALRALRLEADGGTWEAEAWRPLLSAAGEKEEADFQSELAELLARMPDVRLGDLLSSATYWLRQRREILTRSNGPNGARLFRLWDRFADLTYEGVENGAVGDDNDLPTRALNEPGGILAWILLDSLIESKPKAGSGLGLELTPRFNRVARSRGRAGLLGRVNLARRLAYLDAIDPTWTGENLTPRLGWDHPEAPALWQGHASDRIVSARLFIVLKPLMLDAFQRNILSDHELESLIAKLLSVALWRHRGEAQDYELSLAEIRRALTVGPPVVRQHATWQLWRWMGDENDLPADKAERWRTIIGPFFREIWPLDARLRSEHTSENLVFMALECENAFLDAVDAIVDFLVPYRIYQLSHSLRLEDKPSTLVPEYAAASVRLANALIDPAAYPVPPDLATLLQQCVSANPRIVDDPSYIRLFGLQRQAGA
jgi:hypothetical protein